MRALAQVVRLLAVELGWERALAHGGRIRLHDADDPRDLARRDARADGRAARERVRARDVGIDSPVEIAHRAELPLEEDACVLRERRLHERKSVGDPFAQRRGRREHRIRDGTRFERRVAKALQDGVLRLELARDALPESRLVADLVDLNAVPADLVRVRRAHAHAGRAQLAPAALALVETVECDVIRHQKMRAVAHSQIRGGHARLLQLGELAAEEAEIHDGARAEDAQRLRIEDAARHEMELEGALPVDDGMAGVVAALEPDDHVRLLREEVSDLAFALVAPLSTDDGRHRHVCEC